MSSFRRGSLVGGGGGGVTGLTSASGGTAISDNAIIRGEGTSGIQGSGLLIDDNKQIIPLDASGGSAWLAGIRFNRLVDQLPPASDANNPQVAVQTAASGAGTIGLCSAAQVKWSTSNNAENELQQGISKGTAAGSLRITDGSTGIGALESARRVAAEITSPETVAVTDSRKAFTNEGAGGAVTYNLPSAAAGLEYVFIVQATQNMVVDAAAGDTIRVAAGVSSAGGTATNGTIGGVLHLLAINETEWISIASTGTWTLA